MKNFTESVKVSATWLTGLLALSYTLSLFAGFYYLFDLFSHFAFQYAVGGLLLGTALLYCKSWKYATLALAIFFLNSFEIYGKTDLVINDQAEKPAFTIVQYNRRYMLDDHSSFTAWINENKSNFDMLVLLEARSSHVKAAESLKKIFPYQIHEPRQNAFGMVLMSKYPFIKIRPIPLKRYVLDNFAINVVVELPDGNDISVYAVHPPPPTSKNLLLQRNSDMFTTAEYIKNDNASAVIMTGDWNITPYSPHFSALIDKSGLKYQITSLLPVSTWPSHFLVPLFQIPIDHVLFKGNLQLIEKKRGPAMNSDHYPVIATFASSR